MRHPASQNVISTGEAAQILGVSDATIRNWCKAGFLVPAASRPFAFVLDDIHGLKKRILDNRVNRLRRRANKTALEKSHPCDPRSEWTAGVVDEFRRLFATDHMTGLSRALFTAALHHLADADEAALHNNDGSIDFNAIVWRRPAVEAVMRDWLRRNDDVIFAMPPNLVRAFLARRDGDDRLGVLYQTLSSIGARAQTGSYFTPERIIDVCLADLGLRPKRFLDPCCGTGRYLLRAARRFDLEPAMLHGFDSDPVSVDIARLNLLLHYPDARVRPDIRCLDSLWDLANGRPDCDTNHLLEAVDAIASNPPWGSCRNHKRGTGAAFATSGESFSLFLEKALTLLQPGGRLSFLLPEAVLRIKAHAGIRRHILGKTTIAKISLLGQTFQGVFTPSICLNLVKEPAPPDWRVAIVSPGATHDAAQNRFAANPDGAFDVAVTPPDERLLERMHAVPHTTLYGRAQWALGIVTGDNEHCLLESPGPGTEPILRGREVFPFSARPPRRHIRYRPGQFQQVAPERLYRAREKLVYRFISSRLVVAYDDKGMLTLNSANILIPDLPGMSIKTAMAFLNSKAFQYIFSKRFHARKVLKGDLERLPFPQLDASANRRIEELAEQCVEGDRRRIGELDAMIYTAFHLSPEHIAHIETTLAGLKE